jgi:hypothetical protein
MCIISDHAVLRYLERVWKIDVEAARSEMMTAGHAIDVADGFCCDTVKMGNGARLKLKGSTVVKVLPKRGLHG